MIDQIKKQLKEENISGWLLYDFRRSNPLMHSILDIPKDAHMTRRCFYWIPAQGSPVKLIHQIEPHVLAELPGDVRTYASWQDLHAELKELLHGSHKIAMEYSPQNQIPTLSIIDGGMLDLIRSFGAEVVSSGGLLQVMTSLWTLKQYQTHLEATHFLEKCVKKVWEYVRKGLSIQKKITEYDVQQFLLVEFEKHGFATEGAPIVAVNKNSANPHYIPTKGKSTLIKRGDLILLDLWCKKEEEGAIFGDITRMAIANHAPTEKQKEVFDLVRKAQKEAFKLIEERLAKKEAVRGCEVDTLCRQIITEGGYGDFFVHRTGHHLHEELHGPGANLDSYETYDERVLLPSSGYTIEPGIYLPGEFGVRLEHDIFIHLDNRLELTGGAQDAFEMLL